MSIQNTIDETWRTIEKNNTEYELISDDEGVQVYSKDNVIFKHTENAEKEARVANLLREHGVNAPETLSMVNSEVVAMEEIDGQTLGELSIDERCEMAGKAGELLAELHNIGSFDSFGELAESEIAGEYQDEEEYISDYIEEIRDYCKGTEFEQITDELTARIEDSDDLPSNPVLCHDNYHSGNVVVDEYEQVHMIDLEHMKLAYKGADIIRTLMMYYMEEPVQAYEFMHGYETDEFVIPDDLHEVSIIQGVLERARLLARREMNRETAPDWWHSSLEEYNKYRANQFRYRITEFYMQN